MSTFKVTYNIIGTLGWSALLFTSIQHIVTKKNFHVLQDPNAGLILELVQSMQLLEIAMALLRVTKSSFTASLIQVVGRLFVVYFVFPFVKGSDYPAVTVIAWSLADIIRSLYYTNIELKINNTVIEWLRYSAFLVLYPVGVGGEFLSANLALENIVVAKIYYDQNFTVLSYQIPLSLLISIFRVICIPAMALLYAYLLKQRSRLTKKSKTA